MDAISKIIMRNFRVFFNSGSTFTMVGHPASGSEDPQFRPCKRLKIYGIRFDVGPLRLKMYPILFVDICSWTTQSPYDEGNCMLRGCFTVYYGFGGSISQCSLFNIPSIMLRPDKHNTRTYSRQFYLIPLNHFFLRFMNIFSKKKLTGNVKIKIDRKY